MYYVTTVSMSGRSIYGSIHRSQRKIAYREITEYLRIVKLRNVTKRYGVLRYVGLRRVWKLMKYYDA